MKKYGKSALAALALVLSIAVCVSMRLHKRQEVERRIIKATNRSLAGEGECDIFLADIFDDFEWDSVAIFVAGDPVQIKNALKIENDISDGIVFLKAGQPVKMAMSTYQFPQDKPPTISYYVERENNNAPYYISMTYDEAIAHIEKYMFRDGKYRYIMEAA